MIEGFEWDENKAQQNLVKHDISFVEATTVFLDSLSIAIDDPNHSQSEQRYIIIGSSNRGRLLVVVFLDRGTIFVSSAPDELHVMNAEPTKKVPKPSQDEKTNSDLDLRDEYDFRGGVRGKYTPRLARDIQRNMVPEHARETWDAEQAVYGELISRPESKSEED
ncbi:BrnT family toxin [Chroococcidiopsis sp [FACHB-1243]]|uniref:BrnT family toxin n=1 Tax=Chroococcidiopsis sp. [FACHB-1243] TaxID=2692781 RepID=UPI0018EFCBF6|nr:BrnT family toxin [Chroococcidiopsis sp. [FACHB-1243]]